MAVGQVGCVRSRRAITGSTDPDMRDSPIDNRPDSNRGRLGVSGVFLALAFFLAGVTIVLGALWESIGEADTAGGSYAFSAAFIALAVTLAATLPARSFADVWAIALAFAVVFLFGAAQNWHLTGWGLAVLLLGAGALQVAATRWAVNHDRTFGSASEESPASLRQQLQDLQDHIGIVQQQLHDAELRADRAERTRDKPSTGPGNPDQPDGP